MLVNKCDTCRHSRKCPESSKKIQQQIGQAVRVIDCERWKIRMVKTYGQK